MTLLENAGKMITENQVSELETEIGIKIPPKYRSFLLEHNGGQPVPDVVNVEGFAGEDTDVSIFFGINRDKETSNIKWNMEVFSDRIPVKEYLPIACDSGGNIFTVSINNGQGESIHYFELDNEKVRKYSIATDIFSFLEMLRSL